MRVSRIADTYIIYCIIVHLIGVDERMRIELVEVSLASYASLEFTRYATIRKKISQYC